MLSEKKAQEFKQTHQLDDQYINKANKFYAPMVEQFIEKKSNKKAPLFIGVNGCQGSGKSTIADYIATYINDKTDYKTVVFSLDDFYLSKEKREELGENLHPLLATRGVPGTHNTELLKFVVHQLKYGQPVYIPSFNKAMDDVVPSEKWLEVKKADIVIVEGWCLGIPAQTESQLKQPVNEFEKNEDSDLIWRKYVNDNISKNYQEIYDAIDSWVYLKAPSFDSVFAWRKEQEDKLRIKLKDASEQEKSKIMSDEQILRFIGFFQRLTEHGFETLPKISDFCFEFDQHREIKKQIVKNHTNTISEDVV